MMKARFGWKVAAVLLSIIAVAALAGSVAKGSAVLSSIELVFAALGAVQYAFGWPKLRRIVWRIFGPFFSLLMVWALARDIGWLGTRLAIKHLTLGEQAETFAALAITAGFGAVVCVPLYRLGEWRRDRDKALALATLSDTFA